MYIVYNKPKNNLKKQNDKKRTIMILKSKKSLLSDNIYHLETILEEDVPEEEKELIRKEIKILKRKYHAIKNKIQKLEES